MTDTRQLKPIAALPMYYRDELSVALNRLWQHIQQGLLKRGIAAPSGLTNSGDLMGVWLDPGLVLGQTCGMPYRMFLHDKVTLIGTPDYQIADCPAGYYRRIFIVRKNDPRDSLEEFSAARFAYNDQHSQSGYGAAIVHASAKGMQFDNPVVSGAHRLSAAMVAEGTADIAALDVISWQYMQQFDHFSDSLRGLEATEPAPGLPLIAAMGADRTAIISAVTEALDRVTESDQALIGFRRIVSIPAEAYLKVPSPD